MSIKVRNLTYIYGEGFSFEKKALDNINITIEKGEFIGLIGHTGSGKSTFIQHLNGILKPTEGNIYLDDMDIHLNKSKFKNLRHRIGLVMQYPENQLFESTVFKDVSFGPLNMGLSQNEINRRVKNALDLVGLKENIYEKSPFNLSGGEKRRVAIAGVLAMEPEILIMDEPTAGLDPYGRDEMLNKIKNIHSERNNTVILVSHSMEDIIKFVDKLAVFDRGKLVYYDIPSEVFKHSEELKKIGLEVPIINYLIKKLKKKGIHLSENIYTVEDAVKEIYNYFFNNN